MTIWMTCVVLIGLAIATHAATINLAWNPNTEPDVAGYVVSYGTQSNTYTTTVDVGKNVTSVLANLTNGTRYYFIVKAYNASGMFSAASQEVSGVAANVPPTAPAGPIPASGTTGVALSAAVNWAASINATQYDVAFGTTNPPAVVSSNQTSTTYQPGALAPGTTYYWQIVAKGPTGSTSGPIWSLTTAAPGSLVPVAAYAFNEGTGTTAGDASGNGRTGTLTSATWTTAGKFGGALSFDGSSAHVTVADAAPLHLAAAMTLEAWVNPSAAAVGVPSWQVLIYKGSDNYVLALPYGSTTPTAGGTVGGGLAIVTSPNALPANTWAHVAVTYDGAMVRLFVNGSQVDSHAASGPIGTASTPLEIGGSLVDSGAFAGLIDEVRVYNTALTPAQIQTDMITPIASNTDTQVPSAPTTLVVTAVSTTQLALTWAPSTDNVGVTGYRIERCQGAGCSTFSQVGTASATSYSDTGLSVSTSYTYRVRASDAASNLSSYSSVAGATTLTPVAPPTAPASPTPVSTATGVSLAPTLTWAASTNATQYDVAFGTTNPPAVVASNQTVTTYQPVALAAGTMYYWQIVAKGAGGSTTGPVWNFTILPAPTVPASPTPASNATGVSLTTTLSWAASTNATQYDVAFGTTNPPAVVSSNQTATTYRPAALTAGTTYYWQVVAKGPCGATSGPVWSLTTLPPAPTAPSGPMPSNGATGVSATTSLGWAASTNATQYDVAFGTTNPPALVASNQTVTTYQPAALAAGTKYYWQIVAKGAGGSTSGSVWSFTTLSAPTAPAGPTPVTGATGVTVTTALSWAASTNATKYDVSLGTTNPPAVVSSNQTLTTFQPVALTPGTKYYWQVVAKGVGGSTNGSVWSFTTLSAPTAPAGPTPASGATSVSLTTTLSWAASTNATQYDVAFGATNPPAVVSSNQTSTTYQPGALAAGTTYYWQIVAKGAGGSTSGPVWSLTTAVAARPVPVAAYGFNEGTGTTTGDASGNGRTGTLTSTTWTTAGKIGGALSFNGSSARVTVADAAPLHLAAAMTLEAWINPSAAAVGVPSWQVLIYKGSDNYVLALPYGSTAPTAGGTVGGGLAIVTSPNALPANTWTHVAVTYDGAMVRLFVNGTQVDSQAASGLIGTASTPLEIGGSLVDSGAFAGLIDDVRVYNTALTPAQIQTDMTTPVASAKRYAGAERPDDVGRDGGIDHPADADMDCVDRQRGRDRLSHRAMPGRRLLDLQSSRHGDRDQLQRHRAVRFDELYLSGARDRCGGQPQQLFVSGGRDHADTRGAADGARGSDASERRDRRLVDHSLELGRVDECDAV